MWPNPQETGDLVTFIEEILNGKLHFLCNGKFLARIVLINRSGAIYCAVRCAR